MASVRGVAAANAAVAGDDGAAATTTGLAPAPAPADIPHRRPFSAEESAHTAKRTKNPTPIREGCTGNTRPKVCGITNDTGTENTLTLIWRKHHPLVARYFPVACSSPGTTGTENIFTQDAARSQSASCGGVEFCSVGPGGAEFDCGGHCCCCCQSNALFCPRACASAVFVWGGFQGRF